jgi:hypothetical protein
MMHSRLFGSTQGEIAMSDKTAKLLAGVILAAAFLHFLTGLHRAENTGDGISGGVVIYNTVTGSAVWCLRTCPKPDESN